MNKSGEVKIKNTVNRKPAQLFVDGEFKEEFLSFKTDKGIKTGVHQAEAYVAENMKDYAGKTVEIFIAYKKFSFEEVKNIIMKEV